MTLKLLAAASALALLAPFANAQQPATPPADQPGAQQPAAETPATPPVILPAPGGNAATPAEPATPATPAQPPAAQVEPVTPAPDAPVVAEPMPMPDVTPEVEVAGTGEMESVDEIIGSTVQTSDGEDWGEVADMLIDTGNGQVMDIIIAAGGFLGIGEKQVQVPFEDFTLGEDGVMMITMTAAELEAAPDYVPPEETELEGDMPAEPAPLTPTPTPPAN